MPRPARPAPGEAPGGPDARSVPARGLGGLAREVEVKIATECAELAAPTRGREFRTVLDHDVRTCLNSILGFSGLLAECDQLGEGQRRYAAHIHSSAQALFRRIRLVLELAEALGERAA
jgi:signal transduction histidine kinase